MFLLNLIKKSFYNKIFKQNTFLLAILINFTLLTFMVFAQVEFNASIDKKEVVINEPVTLTLTVNGGENPSDPEIPYSTDYDYASTGTASQMQIINGNITSSQSYNYSLVPKKVGKLVLSDISITVQGIIYTAKPITINVTKAPEKIKVNKSDIIFLTAEVSNNKPYVNEQVMYLLKVYRRVQTGDSNVDYPKFKDFLVEEIDRAQEYEKIINGQKYIVTEIKKALYPTRAGVFEIEPTRFKVEVLYRTNDDDFGGFFSQTSTKVKQFNSNALKIKVSTLPSNRPENFSNIVGKDITVETKISQEKAKVGDSLNLEVIIKGKGSIKDFNKFNIDSNDKVKIYPDKATLENYVEEKELITEKKFKFAIVPLEKGKIEIPSVKIPYFNSKKGNYSFLSTKKITLNIAEGDEENTTYDNKPNSTKTKEPLIKNTPSNDIFEIKKELSTLKNQALDDKKIYSYLFIFFLPIVIYAILLLKKTTKINLSNKAKAQNKFYTQALEKIKTLAKDHNANITKELALLLAEYLQAKFGIDKHNTNLELKLKEAKISEELIKRTKQLFEKYEFLKFSGESLNDNKKEELLTLTESLIKDLEGNK